MTDNATTALNRFDRSNLGNAGASAATAPLWRRGGGAGYVEQAIISPPAFAEARNAPRSGLAGEFEASFQREVYAQRDVYGTGFDGMAHLVHQRGHRQLLPSAHAAEVVEGAADYGYRHPDDLQAATERREVTAGDVLRVAVDYMNWRPAIIGDESVLAPVPHRDPAETVGCALFVEEDVSGFLVAEPWRCFGKGDAKRWYIRHHGIYVETANTDEGMPGPRRGRKFTRAEHASRASSVYVQAMEAQGFRFLHTQSPAIAPGEWTRPWIVSGPNDKRLESVDWHVLIHTDAGQKDLYWRIRYVGRLLETWSGGNRPGSDAGLRAGRLYNREEDVLPEVHDLVLGKLRSGYLPHGPEHDDLVMGVAQTDPAVWAVVRVKMAEAMKPRGTVALGRFSTIDEEEDIL